MNKGEILIYVWEENLCDDLCSIIDSYGFSLSDLNEINEHLQDYYFDDYYNKKLLLKDIKWIPPQIGSYPPPNIEAQGYFDFDIVDLGYISQ